MLGPSYSTRLDRLERIIGADEGAFCPVCMTIKRRLCTDPPRPALCPSCGRSAAEAAEASRGPLDHVTHPPDCPHRQGEAREQAAAFGLYQVRRAAEDAP
jgi:hypothetical protein